MYKFIYTISILFLLTACGGEDNALSTATTNNSSSESGNHRKSSSSDESNYNPTTMSAVIVPDDFSFNPVVNEKLTVDISNYSTSASYISLYSKFTDNGDGNFTASYDNRIISTSLSNGKAILNYVSSNSQDTILAEIWFYDGSTTRIQKVIPKTESNWIY